MARRVIIFRWHCTGLRSDVISEEYVLMMFPGLSVNDKAINFIFIHLSYSLSSYTVKEILESVEI